MQKELSKVFRVKKPALSSAIGDFVAFGSKFANANFKDSVNTICQTVRRENIVYKSLQTIAYFKNSTFTKGTI